VTAPTDDAEVVREGLLHDNTSDDWCYTCHGPIENCIATPALAALTRLQERADDLERQVEEAAGIIIRAEDRVKKLEAALREVGRYLAVIPWEPSVGEALAAIERVVGESAEPQEGP
jgi:phage shock protein A